MDVEEYLLVTTGTTLLDARHDKIKLPIYLNLSTNDMENIRRLLAHALPSHDVRPIRQWTPDCVTWVDNEAFYNGKIAMFSFVGTLVSSSVVSPKGRLDTIAYVRLEPLVRMDTVKARCAQYSGSDRSKTLPPSRRRWIQFDHQQRDGATDKVILRLPIFDAAQDNGGPCSHPEDVTTRIDPRVLNSNDIMFVCASLTRKHGQGRLASWQIRKITRLANAEQYSELEGSGSGACCFFPL